MSQKKVHFAEQDESIYSASLPPKNFPEQSLGFAKNEEEPERSLAFGKDEDDNSPANWGAHWNDLNWNANLRALQVELNSNYNYRWWDSPTPEVAIEWPTMRKWATETLHYCLGTTTKADRRKLSQAQQSELLALFEKCQKANLKFLKFTPPPSSSLVENLEQIHHPTPQQQSTLLPVVKEEKEDDESEFQEEELQSTTSDKPSVFMDDVWSLSACNVDPVVPLLRRRNAPDDDDLDELDPIQESDLDWEPPGLQDLDFKANLDTLSISMKLPLNANWDQTQTIYIKDPEVRKWAAETIIQCMERRIEDTKRRDFLELFAKVPHTYLRSISFLNPVSILGSIEEQQTGAEESDSDQESCDDSESSVYL